MLGLWVFFSAFFWRSPAQRWNDWVAGAIAVTVALAGMSGARNARYINAALGAWLVVAAILLPPRHVTVFWSNLVVGVALALVAFIGSNHGLRRQRTARA